MNIMSFDNIKLSIIAPVYNEELSIETYIEKTVTILSHHFKQYDYFRAFLNQSYDGDLIMCHPGLNSTDKKDPLYLARHHELTYFMSGQFLTDLSDNTYVIE